VGVPTLCAYCPTLARATSMGRLVLDVPLSCAQFEREIISEPDREKGVIHLRSAARAGKADLGVNRQRMEELRRKFFDSTRRVG
jgi:DNA invertase Pin-like site-specific DNA recombinase